MPGCIAYPKMLKATKVPTSRRKLTNAFDCWLGKNNNGAMKCLHVTVESSMGGRPKLKNPSVESKCTLTILTSKRNPASELAQPKRNGTKQQNLASKASPPTNMAHNLTIESTNSYTHPASRPIWRTHLPCYLSAPHHDKTLIRRTRTLVIWILNA